MRRVWLWLSRHLMWAAWRDGRDGWARRMADNVDHYEREGGGRC